MCVITEKKLQLNIARLCCHNFLSLVVFWLGGGGGGGPGPWAPPPPGYAYGTKIPYPYFHKQHVPYFWAKIEAYCTYVSYRTGILGCQCLQRRNGKIVTFLTCRLQIWFPFPNLFFVKISQLNTEFNVFYVFSKSWWVSCKLLLRIFEKPCWSSVKTKRPLSFCKASYCFHGMAKLLSDISFNSIFLK